MTESEELHHKVDKILKKVESIDNFMPWLVRPNSTQLKENLLEVFKKKTRAAKVYLAIDGTKNVGEIATFLGIQQPNVSGEIKFLNGLGLIECVIDGANSVYKKNKIDRVLGLSTELLKLFPLNTITPTNGSPKINETPSEDDPEGNNDSIQDTSDNEEKRI